MHIGPMEGNNWQPNVPSGYSMKWPNVLQFQNCNLYTMIIFFRKLDKYNLRLTWLLDIHDEGLLLPCVYLSQVAAERHACRLGCVPGGLGVVVRLVFWVKILWGIKVWSFETVDFGSKSMVICNHNFWEVKLGSDVGGKSVVFRNHILLQ